MDIRKGKKIFYSYQGNKMAIDRELNDEYSKCKVPKAIENYWKSDILSLLQSKINASKGSEKMKNITSYIHLLSIEQGSQYLIDILKNKFDTFSRLILCETLKQFLKYNLNIVLRKRIIDTLSENKRQMLNNPISIDESYLKEQYLKDYDFSTANLTRRISNL